MSPVISHLTTFGRYIMRAKLYEKYYKRGLGYYVLKNMIGVGKPDSTTKRLYYVLMTAVLLLGMFVLN